MLNPLETSTDEVGSALMRHVCLADWRPLAMDPLSRGRFHSSQLATS